MDQNHELVAALTDLLVNDDVNESDQRKHGSAMVAATNAWAVGLWNKTETVLELLQFGIAEGFDQQIAAEFQQATQSVPLDQTQLGIVNAVVNDRPVIARVEEQEGELRKSAGWLDRFGARCSLACPIHDQNGEIRGVFAVSWKDRWNIEDQCPTDLLNLAKAISAKIG